MREKVEDYKSVPRVARPGLNIDRFEATEVLSRERVLLLDDVFTSGGQSEACRRAL